jgi:hypothetical protein
MDGSDYSDIYMSSCRVQWHTWHLVMYFIISSVSAFPHHTTHSIPQRCSCAHSSFHRSWIQTLWMPPAFAPCINR